MNMHEIFKKTQELLIRLRTEAHSPEEKELLAVAYFAFDFIEVTGSFYPFEEFLKTWNESGGHLPTVASFEMQEEADAWLREHSAPPHGAYVLVAGRPQAVFYLRHADRRLLLPMPPLEAHEKE